MLSSHECVNQIQDILSSGEVVTKEKIGGLVWAYASACRQLNEKAQRCLELLRQGRRADAQRLAREPPDLEQELRLLDFPERSAWLDLCETAGLPIGQGLDVDVLDSVVQEVYSEGGALDRLLKTFRRMSIGRAPLADRLRILRQIRQADPQHDLWTEDIRAFEAERHAELLKEAEAADVGGDLRTLENVLGELGSGEWLSAPARFIAAVERIIVPHRRRYALARFAELARDLHGAHGSMDQERCRSLLAQVETVTSQTHVSPDAATEAALDPVVTWLAGLTAAQQEDAAFSAACAALELAIDENKDRLTLEKLAGAVFRFERGMPELLAARFNSRIEELNRRGRRRFALTLTGVVGGILVLAGLVTAVIIWQGRASERERWRGEIAGALEKGDLEGAGRLLAGVAAKNPEVAAAPEIVALRREYERKVQEEAGRLAEFQGLQKKIEEAGPVAPDMKAHARAGEVAITLAEKQWVEDWRQKYEKAADEKKGQRENAFRQKLDELKRRHAAFSAAEQARRTNLDALAAPCWEMTKELAAWTDVPKSLLAEVAAIERHVNQAMKTFGESAGKRQAISAVLERLPSLAESPDELAKTLEAFVRNYPEHQLAAEFTKAAGMGPHWRAAQAWRLLVQQWGNQIRVNDAQTATARCQQVEAYSKAYPGGPFSSQANEYQAYLSAAKAAFSDGRLVGLAKVGDVLNHVVFTPALRMIRTRDGRAYYVLEKDLREQRANEMVMGYNLKYMTSTMPGYADGRLSKSDVTEGPVQTPQAVFAVAARYRVDRFEAAARGGPGQSEAAGWETFYLELAAMTQEAKGMDPVLTGQVLQLILDFAARTTPYKGDDAKRWAEQIGRESLDFITWLDPNSLNADQARPRVAQILKNIGPLLPVVSEVRKRVDAVCASMCAYRPVGVLLAGSGPVQIAQAPPDGKAYVLWGKPGETPGFIEIGSIQGGKFTGDPAVAALYPQGSPVFVRVSK